MLGSLRLRLGGFPGVSSASKSVNSWGLNQLNEEKYLRLICGTRRNYYYHTRNERTTIQKTQEVRQNRAHYARRHIWPRVPHPHPPKKGDNQTWTFKVKEVRFAIRGIKWYARMLKNLHLQDAIDWIAAIPVNRLQKFFELLTDAQRKVIDMGGDPTRVYIKSLFPEVKKGIKHMVMHRGNSQWGYGVMTAHRHTVVLILEQLNPGEYFHKVHILKKVPRSLSNDMRVALHERRAGPQAVREWWPYLSSHTRYHHHREMKREDGDREFDYYEERKKFLRRYFANVRRRKDELLSARSGEGRIVKRVIAEHNKRFDRDEKKSLKWALNALDGVAPSSSSSTEVTVLGSTGVDLNDARIPKMYRDRAKRLLQERAGETGSLTTQIVKDVETYVPGGVVVTESIKQATETTKKAAKATGVRVGKLTSGLKKSIKSGWANLRSGKKEE